MSPCALPHCKYAVNLAVARGAVNMQPFELASIWSAPPADLELQNCFFQKNVSSYKLFFELPLIEEPLDHKQVACQTLKVLFFLNPTLLAFHNMDKRDHFE